jgi:xanthine dehydrogenase accessory factor
VLVTSLAAGLVQRMGALDAAAVPYVHATVVRAQPPTSTWPGAAAIVLGDGTMEGFVGGQCAESSVRAVALEALDTGEPVLLRILPEDDEEFPEAPGARTVVNPCLSGGAIELFLAPHLPPRRLVVVGHTPIADALAPLAETLGFRTVRSDEAATSPLGATAMVVSSHGHGEGEAIRAALDAGVGFIGLVASTRRGAAVLDELDLDDDERARVHTPVGVDIGARTPEEIALSIMAEVVRAIRVEGLVAPPGGDHSPDDNGDAPASPPPTAVDPICGMTVVAAPPTLSLEVDGGTVWFCNPGCQKQFADQTAG